MQKEKEGLTELQRKEYEEFIKEELRVLHDHIERFIIRATNKVNKILFTT